jgi:hypothetical protein
MLNLLLDGARRRDEDSLRPDSAAAPLLTKQPSQPHKFQPESCTWSPSILNVRSHGPPCLPIKSRSAGLSPVGAHGFGYTLQLATNGEDGFGVDRRAAEHTNHRSSHMDGKLSAYASFRNKHERESLSFIEWL